MPSVASSAVAEMVQHARESAPAECCGLLLGHDTTIIVAVRTRNVADDPASRFLVDPQGHFDGRRAARERGLEVVGFYHSHPRSPATPSQTDRAEATYPHHLYLIVSLAANEPDVRLFRYDEGNFVPLPFVTVA